jgi:transposase InsO family protein
MVRQIYEKYRLFAYRVTEDEPETPRCRYEASQVNLIWHTDLHLYSLTHEWMIAFIDDASRRLMGWAFLTDKKAISTRAVLETTIDTNHVTPYAIWSDNGTEFKGAFQDLLQEQHIHHVHTAPRNPQQNGKMERFWPTIERCPSRDAMEEWIEGYNRSPHQGLGKFKQSDGTMVRMTPIDAYARLQQWPSSRGPYWKVEGRERLFVVPGPVTGEAIQLELE